MSTTVLKNSSVVSRSETICSVHSTTSTFIFCCLYVNSGCVITSILVVALPAQILASISDAQTGQFPVNNFLGPVLAFAVVATLINCICALGVCKESRNRAGRFDTIYSPKVFCRLCCCGCPCRRCCRKPTDSLNVIVVLHAPGIAPIDM